MRSILLTLVSVALIVVANPVLSPRSPVSLSFAKHISTTGTVNLIEKDRARVKTLSQRVHGSSPRGYDDVLNNTDVSYLISVGVGTPPTFYNLIVDTGSSNLWVGADPSKPYVTTLSSRDTGNTMNIPYGSGTVSGEEYTDTVTIGELVINGQGVGAATQAVGFQGVDGILGIGPQDLTAGTLSPDESATVPTVVDNAFAQMKIAHDLVAISFEPATSTSQLNGELTFGDVDPTKYTGPITYASITSNPTASLYWGIDQTIKYGPLTILSGAAGIVDTGTTLLGLSPVAYAQYQLATGAMPDPVNGLLRIPESEYDRLQNLTFTIAGTDFVLTPNAQIWPRSLNKVIGGIPGAIYLVAMDLGPDAIEGIEFINGQVFLERFYSVFDTSNRRVGLATTQYTNAETN